MIEIQEVREGVVHWTRHENGARTSGQRKETNYEAAVWAMLDPDATWPTLPESISLEDSSPERYFDECIQDEIRHARQAIEDIEKAGWQAGDAEDAIERLREALTGLEISAKGRELLAQARLADTRSGA